MTKLPPDYLRLHVESLPEETPIQAFEDLTNVRRLCQAFHSATGQRLDFSPESVPQKDESIDWASSIPACHGSSPGSLAITNAAQASTEADARVSLPQAIELAEAIGDTLGELFGYRRELVCREAELAAAVPLVRPLDGTPGFADRLESVLKGGAEAVGCQAAALYLLDDATSELKLRSTWGLPAERFVEPARPLHNAMADLEALLGQVVAIEDVSLLPHWRVPENFASVVCVPVSSATVPMGTLWMFCDRVRDFTDRETNLIEIIAGRLASDLECELMLTAGISTDDTGQELAAAARARENQLPQTSPLVDGWDLTGYTATSGPLGGAFYNWYALEDGTMAVATGCADSTGVESVMTATAVLSSLRSHCNYPHTAVEMLDRVNETLWTGSAGEQLASLFYGRIDPTTGRIELASTGGLYVLAIRPHGCDIICGPGSHLGSDDQWRGELIRQVIAKGDSLVAISDPAFADGGPIDAKAIYEALAICPETRAEEIARLVAGWLWGHDTMATPADSAILVARRTQ